MLSTAPAEAASCCPPQALSHVNHGAPPCGLPEPHARVHCPARDSDQVVWCRRRDSNSHSFRHYPLKIACLPISPRRLGEKQYCLAPGFQALQVRYKGFRLCVEPIAGESFQALHSNPNFLLCSTHNCKKTQESAARQSDYFGTAGAAGAEASAAAAGAAAGAEAPATAGADAGAAPITPSDAAGL
ncbi:hypothetical protein CBM2592_A90354 [Cupriavidus taiwanensis]|nr:hypothetical protein CBM2588_A60262 [Cupriavidus taiwanensis]SOY57068.1 hypothetical protein CBM2592_A90354 [Cupriavidus taiwanensis]SOY79153.1 hypothetical protein CBM2591_A100045 [Cupriavidus taiwanensis]SOZ25933.1 hypothetical protein CBM2608_A60087 [Cupriavidus taiwanensis]SOZ64557.1 hypothetical protein CBM2617_A80045 [Cupriavidus taiwanensis]